MNCRQIQQWLESELTSAGIKPGQDIRRHLDGCPECRFQYEGLLALRGQLAPLGTLTLTSAEADQIMTNLSAGMTASTERQAGESIALTWLRSLVRPALAAAALLVIALAGASQPPVAPVVSHEFQDLQLTQSPRVDILSLLTDGDEDGLPTLVDQSSAAYITARVNPAQAAGILDSLSRQEIEYLVEHVSLEL